MLSPSHRQSCNKIHGNNFPFPFWNWKRLQQSYKVLILNLYLLKFHAPWNIFSDVLFHSWIKVLLSGCSNYLLISRVTRIWSLMDFIHNDSPQLCYIWNINYAFIRCPSSSNLYPSYLFSRLCCCNLSLTYTYISSSASWLTMCCLKSDWKILRDATCISSFYVLDLKIKLT